MSGVYAVGVVVRLELLTLELPGATCPLHRKEAPSTGLTIQLGRRTDLSVGKVVPSTESKRQDWMEHPNRFLIPPFTQETKGVRVFKDRASVRLKSGYSL